MDIRKAKELGFTFGEMHPGIKTWNYFPEDQALQKAFAAGWKDGQDWFDEKQDSAPDLGG